MKIIKEIKKR